MDELKTILPYALIGLLWMSAFLGGQYLLTTTIEEKSNKLMEVLLSAVSPLTLMTGKVLGQGLVSSVMLVMYGALGIGALIAFATTDLIPMWLLLLTAVYFAMAYLYIASMMAAVRQRGERPARSAVTDDAGHGGDGVHPDGSGHGHRE